MSDDYIRYSIKPDFENFDIQNSVGSICIYNGDCHPNSNCVNNKCVSVTNLPAMMPCKKPSAKQLGTVNENGQECLSNSDCKSNNCNRFSCSNKMIINDAPMTRCIFDSDCYGNTKCTSHFNCK